MSGGSNRLLSKMISNFSPLLVSSLSSSDDEALLESESSPSSSPSCFGNFASLGSLYATLLSSIFFESKLDMIAVAAFLGGLT